MLSPAGDIPSLLNSYLPAQRRQLIDTYFQLFYQRFSRFPSSIADRYIDSLSLDYLSSHYTVVAALFTKFTDVFPYVSYSPSRQNAAVPAQDAAHRLPLVISHLNPPTFFGDSVTSANLDAALQDFALKDLNENTRLVLGADNQTPVSQYLPEFQHLLDIVIANRHPLSINRLTASDFGNWFLQYYPLTSPAYHYRATSNGQTVVYYHNPFYQLKLEQQDGVTRLTHLTVFNQRLTEDFRQDRNQSNFYRPTIFPLITTTNSQPLDLDLASAQFTPQFWRLKITNGDRFLELTPQAINTKNLPLTLPESPQIQPTSTGYFLDSAWLPFHTPLPMFLFNLLKLLLVLALVIRLLGLSLKLEIRKLPLVITLFGSLLWSLTTFKSGAHTIFGLSFWGPQGHDAFVHLSLIESFKRSLWPLHLPTLSGVPVVNYHILFDYLTALLSRFLDIPALDLYFRYLSPMLAVAIGLLSLRLLRTWRFSPLSQIISLLLIYAAGSLGFVAGESVFWANQAVSTLLNPPFALSLVLLLIWLNLFNQPLTGKRLFLLAVLAGLLIQAKAYASVLLLLALATSVVKHRRLWPLLLLSVIFTAIFFLPTYAQGQSLFIFSPLWFLRSLVSSPDRLNWPDAASALLNYPASGQLVKFVLLELFLLLIFVIGNFGVRLLSLPYIIKNRQPPHLSLSLVYWLIAFGLLLPLLFIQTANPWNTIQFLYYSLFFTALLSGPTIADFITQLQTLPQFLLLVSALSLTAFFTTYVSLKDYLSPTPAAYIGYTELLALDRLSRQPPGTVISPDYHLSESRSYTDPKPLFAYTSTAYVSALTGHPSYLADEINLSISGYDFANRKHQLQRLYRTTDPEVAEQLIRQKNITYVLTNPQFSLRSQISDLRSLFDSSYFNLYAVKE